MSLAWISRACWLAQVHVIDPDRFYAMQNDFPGVKRNDYAFMLVKVMFIILQVKVLDVVETFDHPLRGSISLLYIKMVVIRVLIVRAVFVYSFINEKMWETHSFIEAYVVFIGTKMAGDPYFSLDLELPNVQILKISLTAFYYGLIYFISVNVLQDL